MGIVHHAWSTENGDLQMMWIAWRRHRLVVVISAICLGLAIFILVQTSFELTATFQSLGLATCLARHLTCDNAYNAFNDFFNNNVVPFMSLLYVLPLLVGMFVGSPLIASEAEQHTHLLIWTQSITRMRWLWMMLSVLVGATLLVFAVLAAFVTWWSGPVNAVLGPWRTYDWQGTVPLAYALFALALGVTVGTLTKRNVAAIALTLVGFVALRLAVELWLRPHFSLPLKYSWPYGQHDPRTFLGDLDIYRSIGAPPGQSLSSIIQLCGGPGRVINPGNLQLAGTSSALSQCLRSHGVVYLTIYQPATRFWLFQGIESAIFLLLSVLLLGFTIWWVRWRFN
jgi:hypothetical protein